MQRLTTQQIATEAIGDREWVAVNAVAGLELPFEVGTPAIIGRQDRAGWLAGMTDATALPLLRHYARLDAGRCRDPESGA
jgi:hypothetical protein